jgi:hypothetical protein
VYLNAHFFFYSFNRLIIISSVPTAMDSVAEYPVNAIRQPQQQMQYQQQSQQEQRQQLQKPQQQQQQQLRQASKVDKPIGLTAAHASTSRPKG